MSEFEMGTTPSTATTGMSESRVSEPTITEDSNPLNGSEKESGGIGENIKATDTYVYMDRVKDILSVAMKTEKNVILYGPGGHGKSEYTVDFLAENNISPYIITMGTGMTTDRLFGGLNIPTFDTTGKIEYLIENSFMNNEFVVFEELFDAPDFILEQLKDILSSGVFRNGTQVFEIKTKLIICCTNKTREEFSKNNSLKALMERFPLEANVIWKDYNRISYEHLLKTKMGFSDPMLPYIFEEYAKSGIKISPRIALTAAEIVDQCGPEALIHVADLNAKPEILKTAMGKFKSLIEINQLVKDMNVVAEQLSRSPLDTLESVKEAGELNKALFSQLSKMKAIKADDSLVAMTTEAIKKYTGIHENIKKKLAIIMTVDGIQ